MNKKIEELNGFRDLRIVDNFYQTSSFFPMPTTEIGTLSESGQTNIGSYSLCFPYYIDRHIVSCRFRTFPECPGYERVWGPQGEIGEGNRNFGQAAFGKRKQKQERTVPSDPRAHQNFEPERHDKGKRQANYFLDHNCKLIRIDCDQQSKGFLVFIFERDENLNSAIKSWQFDKKTYLL